MRCLVLVVVALMCGACSSSTSNNFDPNDSAAGAAGGGATNGSSGATSGSSGSGTTSAGTGSTSSSSTGSTTGATTGTTSTSETGFGTWSGPTQIAVNAVSLSPAGAGSFTAIMFEAALSTTQLCDGHTLTDASSDPRAVAITFTATGTFDSSQTYSIGPGQAAQVMELSTASTASPTFGPYGTTHAAASGSLSFTTYDQHLLQATFTGEMPSFPDGGGLVPFSGTVQGSACQ